MGKKKKKKICVKWSLSLICIWILRDFIDKQYKMKSNSYILMANSVFSRVKVKNKQTKKKGNDR